jgi:hypothetical protein
MNALEDQGNKCMICNKPFDYSHHLNPRAPAQDHKRLSGEKKDQRTNGSPRGVICRQCNMGIGQLGHDPAILRAAADYLDEWSEIERAREEEGCRADELGEGD